MNLKKITQKISNYYLICGTILLAWTLVLMFNKTGLSKIVLLVAGAVIGHLLKEIDWFFLKSSLKNKVPLILLPLTIFIITSTAGVFGKAIIIFFNLRLILDKPKVGSDN